MAWGGHENWAADRGCHAATCSWKEIPRKHGCIHGRFSPNPPPTQVTKPVPRRIGGTQAHKLLLRGFDSTDRKSCHLHQRLSSTRHPVIIAGYVMSPPETHLTRTALASHQICHRSSIPHEQYLVVSHLTVISGRHFSWYKIRFSLLRQRKSQKNVRISGRFAGERGGKIC